jgi:putative phosphoesterase
MSAQVSSQDGIMRFDIVSDTHGRLSDELLEALQGADMIMHAGDCCGYEDYRALCDIAPVAMCLGNNDWGMDYGPEVGRVTRLYRSGLRWQICHYVERLDLTTCDVAICGHSHRPFIEWESTPGGSGKILVMNPGSPTFPRTADGPTIGRVLVTSDGTIKHAEIVRLKPTQSKKDDGGWRFLQFFR